MPNINHAWIIILISKDDDEYYEDEEDEEDDDDGEYIPSGSMSLSLMAALGLNTEGITIETDWKPPEVTGKIRSDKLILITNVGLSRSN